YEQITVICLRKGEYRLPQNVCVYVLPRNRFGRTWQILQLSSTLLYDAVFVHMNPEYLVAAGWLWRLLGKKTALWYTHKAVNLRLRIAALFADVIFTASEESFRLRSHKVRIVGHGIDTDFFSPDLAIARGHAALSAGRLTRSKRHDLAIERAAAAGVELRIAGEGPERAHLEALAKRLGARVDFLGPLTQVQLRDEYRRAAYLVHTSETGSLDKVVLEALACGCPVRTDDQALKFLEHEGRAYVVEHHSLRTLIKHLVEKVQ
ncbi:MAG: glycosyltransferase family 4 protein, partial [Patescibacteria group bacterium]|nr:glycosyltransferase family 4 protein [Patescibacteria group bacterium]